MTPGSHLSQLITGYCPAQAVYVAAKLNLADLLADGPRGVADLAAVTGTHEHSLYRLMRMLAGHGIFAEQADGRFALTPEAEFLRDGVPGSQKAFALMMGEEHYRAYGELLYSVQTGRTSFEKLFGQPVFEYLAHHPEPAATFDAAMTAIHGRETAVILDALDLSGVGVFADIGGGNGSVLTETLRRHPSLRAILFDLPHVVERARPNLAGAGLLDRCDLVSGDFFASVPAGADAYFLRHIIHDWDDARAAAILRNCRAALKPGGRVLVAESVIPPGNDSFFGKDLDLTMLVLPGGQERTEGEYRALFAAAGLRLSRIVPTASELSVLEAVAA
ncbi:MAG: methyltransferase [Gemmataceae bacterium]